jgi:hypothetical protein
MTDQLAEDPKNPQDSLDALWLALPAEAEVTGRLVQFLRVHENDAGGLTYDEAAFDQELIRALVALESQNIDLRKRVSELESR